MANDVTFTHPDYDAAFAEWTLVKDAAAGERQIKAKGDEYLPRPNAADTSKANQTRYDQYLARAVYYNVTGRTVRSLSGLAFRRWPEIELPSQLDAFVENATGAGVSLIQHAQATLSQILKTGRGGLLADYPRTDGPQSLADQQSGSAQPTLSYYTETAITNWKTMKVGSRVVLSLVVLMETHEVDGGWEVKLEPQYRVLRLVGGIYRQELWRKQRSDKGAVRKNAPWVLADAITPRQGNGQPWKEIPFQFIGSQNNDATIDQAPMGDIAALNIAHYRNSADYEDSVYIVGQPQIVMAGLEQQWVDMLEEKGVYIGSRAPLPLPEGGSAQLLQAAPNTLCKEAMDQKERQMAAIGARLIAAGSAEVAQRTATQVESDDATAHSVLSLCCDNVSKAYQQALRWAANFANATGNVVFSIATEFTKIIDAPTLQVMLQLVQAGKMPEADLFSALRVAGYIDSEKTDDEIRDEISAQAPPATGGALDDDGAGSAEAA
jgi:hypothetical protein